MLDLESDKPLRRPSQLVSLVTGIAGALPSDEDRHVEWKSQLDLTHVDGRFTAAKAVLGMANRPVHVAASRFGGLGYVVVGAEPGRIDGIDVPYPADLEPALVPFIGESVMWTPFAVTVGDANVLVIAVEPPQSGDPLHPLRKQHGKYAAGAIFVRHLGRTPLANANDIAELSARAAHQSRERISGLTVSPPGSTMVQPVDVSEAAVQTATQAELETLPPIPRPTDPAAPKPFITVPAVLGAPRAYSQADVEAIRNDYVTYLGDFRRSVPDRAFERAFDELAPRTHLVVTNTTSQGFTGVRVQLELPNGLLGFVQSPDAWVPERPVAADPFSAIGQLRLTSSIGIAADRPTIRLLSDGRTISMDIGDLHPFESRETPWFVLIQPVSDTSALPQLTGKGFITATAVDDRLPFEVQLSPKEHIVSAATLLEDV